MTKIIARNSAPSSTNRPAALKKARIRNSTECTGLRAVTTIAPAATNTIAKSQNASAWMIIRSPCRALAVGRVQGEVLGDLRLPAVAIREQFLLVVEELLARLGRKLEIRALDDGIDRARLLAES